MTGDLYSTDSVTRSASDVTVIGGGAAGLLAALFAARGGVSTTLLESSKACGLKILVSGGGRCNILPVETSIDDFHTSGSRNVLKRVFRTWPLDRVRRFFEDELDVPLVEEADTGKLFPQAQSARVVRDALVDACRDAGVAIHEGWRVRAIRSHVDGFDIESIDGRRHVSARVILATGGRSLPKTGSDGAGYGFATALGHSIVDPYPALVPLETVDDDLRALTGVALPVRWRALVGGKTVEERVRAMLFTHRGFSGPAMLDASHWSVRDGARIEVAWNGIEPDTWRDRLRSAGASEIANLVSRELPRRLAQILLDRSGVPEGTTGANLGRRRREALISALCAFELPVTGDLGYGVAEVTGGGVPLSEVNPSTLESRHAPGLFLCGEILDCIGRIGGYNFLWAWVTGRLAGESASAASC